MVEKQSGMESVNIREISSEADVVRLVKVARRVWREANVSFCSAEQVEYMLARYQSFEAILGQMMNGYRYFVFEHQGDIVGYFGVQNQGPRLFLSKFYVLREWRGLGLFSLGLEVMRQICHQEDMGAIYLTVNRENYHACEVYRHKGFEVIAQEDNDIGCGFVMNDYIMELAL